MARFCSSCARYTRAAVALALALLHARSRASARQREQTQAGDRAHPSPPTRTYATDDANQPEEEEDVIAALVALRDANPTSELPEVWRGDGRCGAVLGWPGVKASASGRVAELVLDGRGLVAVPGAISGLRRGLTKLWLANNGVRALAPEVAALSNLDSLWLGGNLLRAAALPPTLAGLTALRTLSLPGNLLEQLPEGVVAGLPALEWLDVSENRLAALPAALGRVTTLTRVDAHSNALVSVPPELGRLSALKHLSLHFNALEALPDALGDCRALVWLSLHANKLRAVPAALGRLSNVTRLSLHMLEVRAVMCAVMCCDVCCVYVLVCATDRERGTRDAA